MFLKYKYILNQVIIHVHDTRYKENETINFQHQNCYVYLLNLMNFA